MHSGSRRADWSGEANQMKVAYVCNRGISGLRTVQMLSCIRSAVFGLGKGSRSFQACFPWSRGSEKIRELWTLERVKMERKDYCLCQWVMLTHATPISAAAWVWQQCELRKGSVRGDSERSIPALETQNVSIKSGIKDPHWHIFKRRRRRHHVVDVWGGGDCRMIYTLCRSKGSMTFPRAVKLGNFAQFHNKSTFS